MPSVKWDEPPKDRSIYVMNRTAIDPFGAVGLLFDAYRDEVINTLVVNRYKKSNEYRDIHRCKIICGGKIQHQTIHGMLEIDDATRLSLVLNLREKYNLARIIDYDLPIKENTRLFWFTHIKRTNQLPEEPERIKYIDKQNLSQTKATHVITSVEWGIDIAVVLQLPNEMTTMKDIDSILDKIRSFLLGDQMNVVLETNEKNLLRKILNTKIYSNINEIKKLSTLLDICMHMQQNKFTIPERPVSYKIRPIAWLFPEISIMEFNKFIPIPVKLLNSIEQYVIQINGDMRKLMTIADRELPKQLFGKLPKVVSSVQKMCAKVKSQCDNEIERFTRLVLRARRGEIELSTVQTAIRDNQTLIMKSTIRNLNQILQDLDAKALFIHELNQQNIRYINIMDYGVRKSHNTKMIENKLIQDDEYDRILCSSDTLNNNNHEQLDKLRDNLVKQRETNSDLQLIYADFSYSSYELKTMMLLPRRVFNIDRNNRKRTDSQMDDLKKKNNLFSMSTKISSTKFVTMSQRTDVSLPSESSSDSEGSFEEKRTVIETTIGTPFDELSAIDIEAYHPLLTKINIYGDIPSETIYVALVPTEMPNPKPETPPILPEVKSEVSLPSTVRKPVIISPPKAKDILQLPAIVNPENKILNILLIGETGVGKSTFINALANYLTFDTFEKTENNQPVVLIPGSFLVKNGVINAEQQIVKFGDLKTEIHKHLDHPGRSITERCRSYEFDLKDINNQKIRFIDTPGFGDARGLLQDDHHMQQIVKYIKQYSPLNIICFFLNADDIRVNIFLRSCLTQLFSFLGRNLQTRIIFCFTNSRPTFYAPGKTYSLLKRILKSFALINIPLTKGNTFCFDNESFRYLVGLQNGISFSDLEKKDCETSWSKSVAETKRFVQAICNKRTA